MFKSILAGALATLPAAALALMPPHATNVEPNDGGELTSRVIKIEGYTLGSLDSMAKIVGPKGETIPFTSEMKCASEGEGDAPGAVQSRCTGTLTLQGKLPGGQSIVMTLFRNKFTWKVPAAGLPATPAKKATK